jgi:hypothetical protein
VIRKKKKWQKTHHAIIKNINYFISREILVDLQIRGGAQLLLSGFHVTESADSEGLNDATALLKRSVSVVCLLLPCLSFSNISFSLYICIISCSVVNDFHSMKLIRLSQHEIASAIVILFSSSTDPLLSSLPCNLWPRTAFIISESANV